MKKPRKARANRKGDGGRNLPPSGGDKDKQDNAIGIAKFDPAMAVRRNESVQSIEPADTDAPATFRDTE